MFASRGLALKQDLISLIKMASFEGHGSKKCNQVRCEAILMATLYHIVAGLVASVSLHAPRAM